ncbi:MAG: glycine--tRNA ligase subunit beta [Caldilineaceae bacterium]|nr:glycine--tRNA ligase subunit beta [Caldilineaceae bacterium]
MSTIPSMQEVIRRLHEYWAARGCTIWQPHSEKVGAGTMNPATVLRVLGPEPWSVAYVEPSFRADDGRYAENPNRMQMHTQYQVILKPDPGNPQELYLGSLEAIGLDRTRHDIRFVEDNWESPALGAWGLGWEVWLDGQEITQFTYFQQAGSLPLDPVSVEITYGLERIVMYLQQKSEVWSIDYDGHHTYGEIYKQQEIEHCVYNFELADVERQKMLYDIYKAEAEACIARGLVAPAHDNVLRQSQTFNILDSRGAIGVTERAKFFADMRSQAKRISELYVENRQREEYPWLGEETKRVESGDSITAPISTLHSPISTPQSLLLEIGSEELPPKDVTDGIAQIQVKLGELLAGANLDYEKLAVTGTTRRLVAHVTGLVPRQQDETIEKKGPPADRAFDSLGQPTKAALGFARGQGVEVADLEVRDNYVWAVQHVAGKATADVLPQLLTDLLDGMRWGKTMRWNASNAAWPRPLRWMVALYGEMVVPVAWAGILSGRTSRGPRFADAAADLPAGEFTTFEVANADAYFDAVAAQGVVLDREERRQRIAQLVADTAAQAGGCIPHDPDLLDEVTDLIESPTPVLGSFEAKYLELPTPVLIGVMKKHQRYFPVEKKEVAGDAHSQLATRNSQLLPHFITVANSNGLAHPEVVRAGNEGVIRARYADAAFFFRNDTARSLESFTPRLGTLTFHAKLGSMLDKVQRLERLAPKIGQMLGGSADELATVGRAAALSKSDLVTSMVVEMTSLQGIIGEIYAQRSGETPAVAQAIREHYLPRFAGDSTPATLPGLALSLADKLDSLAGLFAVGVSPSGSADPFGLRRAALGIVNNLISGQIDFSVNAALSRAASHLAVEATPQSLADAGEFVTRRLQGVLLEMGYAHDVVEAVLAERGDNPAAAERACAAFSALVAGDGWDETFTAYARCARIVRSLDGEQALAAAAYETEAERTLHAAWEQAQSTLDAAEEPAAVLGAQLHSLTAPINSFFDAVLINAEDLTVRQARQALVQRIAALSAGIADLSRLQGF